MELKLKKNLIKLIIFVVMGSINSLESVEIEHNTDHHQNANITTSSEIPDSNNILFGRLKFVPKFSLNKGSIGIDSESPGNLRSGETHLGLGLSLELISELRDGSYLGLGSFVELHRGVDRIEERTYSFNNFCLYGLFKLLFSRTETKEKFLLLGNLGFNKITGHVYTSDEELNLGIYYSIGFGAKLKKTFIEFEYKSFVNRCRCDDPLTEENLNFLSKYTLISFSLGFIIG